MSTIKNKKTILTSSDYEAIKNLYENAESYDKKEFDNEILEQFDCDTIRDDRLDKGKCPDCGEYIELEPFGSFEYEYQGFNGRQSLSRGICNSCGWTSDD